MLKQYEELSTAEQRQFSDAVNKLLSVQFIVKTKTSDSALYYFVEEHLELLQNYLEMIDYSVEIFKTDGIVTLKHKEGKNRMHLKMHETIVFLILRLMYEQQSDELDLYDFVEIQVSEIYDMFQILGLESKILNKKTMAEVLTLAKRYHLIDVDGLSSLQLDTEVRILPSMKYAIEAETIVDLYQKLRDFAPEEEVEAYEETDEN